MSPVAFDPLASSSPLIVYIDYIKRKPLRLSRDDQLPTYALAEELGIEIDWRPFTLDIASSPRLREAEP